MSVLIFLMVGIFIGSIARMFSVADNSGLFGDLILGITGAFAGGFLYKTIGFNIIYDFWGSLVLSTFGSIAFLYFVKQLFRTNRYS